MMTPEDSNDRRGHLPYLQDLIQFLHGSNFTHTAIDAMWVPGDTLQDIYDHEVFYRICEQLGRGDVSTLILAGPPTAGKSSIMEEVYRFLTFNGVNVKIVSRDASLTEVLQRQGLSQKDLFNRPEVWTEVTETYIKHYLESRSELNLSDKPPYGGIILTDITAVTGKSADIAEFFGKHYPDETLFVILNTDAKSVDSEIRWRTAIRELTNHQLIDLLSDGFNIKFSQLENIDHTIPEYEKIIENLGTQIRIYFESYANPDIIQNLVDKVINNAVAYFDTLDELTQETLLFLELPPMKNDPDYGWRQNEETTWKKLWIYYWQLARSWGFDNSNAMVVFNIFYRKIIRRSFIELIIQLDKNPNLLDKN